ncbi:DUF262 domain-containing protein [Piscibacillus halophilus]|uniref:DUF262 domain-containing protein n=1 Tax=Piscibacillus halophilus TaxID=571933 RepID=UPI00158B1997|nr:DUF262 domain-containing protein [Piscibacillus halophilus]
MNDKNGVILKRDSNNITISEFYENEMLQKYNYDPEYQRKSDVWSIEKQAFLIDSIMKNYPIPPIFLHVEIDNESGKTIYHVIDGKQRLTAIKNFIEGSLSLPENFGDDEYGSEDLNGLNFKDINPNSPYKNNFWKYRIPIEYVDTDNPEIVNTIFDRLNRNGQPLNDQELRNAKYSDSAFLQLVKKLSVNCFWKNRLNNIVEVTRMEDEEFISELIFTLLEGTIDAKPKTIDELYDKWVLRFESNETLLKDINDRFLVITKYLSGLNIDYEGHKIQGVSHLYGLWGFSISCLENDLKAEDVRSKLDNFFEQLRSKDVKIKDKSVERYSHSMSYSTKSKGQRKKRISALCDYCDIPNENS